MIVQRIEVRLQPSTNVPDEFEGFFSRVADAYYECTGILDQDLSGDATVGALTFCMGVPATDPGDAITQAVSIVRAVMHEVGAGTPGWEQHIDIALRGVGAQTSPQPMIAA